MAAFWQKNGPVTLSANEALEEALCFGWIDSQIQSLGNKTYKKYFSIRRKNSKWSEKTSLWLRSLSSKGKWPIGQSKN